MLSKIISIFIIIALFFSLFPVGFTSKVKAAGTDLSGAVEQAIASGAACFAAQMVAGWARGLAAKSGAAAEGATNKAATETAINVPAYDARGSANSATQQRVIEASGKGQSCIRDAMIKILMNWLVDQIVDWIQNGGELKDRFVTNWENFEENVWQKAAGAVIQQAVPGLCSPFKMQVEFSFMPVQKFFKDRTFCTLDQVVDNIEDFYDNFENGGWLAYNTMWEPQNNYFGATLMIRDEAILQATKKAGAEVKDAQAGFGFRSVKQCKGEIVSYPFEDKDGMLYANNSEFSVIAAKYGYEVDKDGNYCKSTDMEYLTPGQIVGNIAQQAVEKDMKYLQTLGDSQDYAKWVSAIINASINRIMKEGLSAARESNAPMTENESAAVTAASSESANATAGALNAAIAPAVNDAKEKAGKIINNVGIILPLKTDSLAFASSIKTTLQTIKDKQSVKATACPPVVDNNKITELDTKISTLTKEKDDLNTVKTKVDDFLATIDDPTMDAQAKLDALSEFDMMLADYPIINSVVLASDGVSKSQTEKSGFETQKTNAENQLNSCLAIKIAGGAATTNSPTVNLNFNYGGTSEVSVSDPTQATVSGCDNTTITYYSMASLPSSCFLGTNKGQKTISVKFKDASYNESSVYSATIKYE